jgi:CO/xanthine dehydrogenase FAD-binding subunit
MVPGAFEYFAPRSLSEAVKFLSEHRDDVKVLSGARACCR